MSYDLIFTLLTLTFLEIILGIDNLIFIALVVQKLPQKFRRSARIFGLSLAFIIRVLMLLTLSWVMSLTEPLFFIGDIGFSYKDFLLFAGGVFLVVKSTGEIWHEVMGHDHQTKEIKASDSFMAAVVQISLIDFVFSFDSVITAIAMTNNVKVIVVAVMFAMLLMFVASGFISSFLAKYPSLKIVALAFIFMVGIILLGDGLHMHISKGYLYFSLFFTLTVEYINILARRKVK